jgi:hypothetical protein
MSKDVMVATKGDKFVSPYQRRLQMVVDTIQRHEKLSDKSAAELAVRVLHTLDHIPERIR